MLVAQWKRWSEMLDRSWQTFVELGITPDASTLLTLPPLAAILTPIELIQHV
jgi:hypothetical protein